MTFVLVADDVSNQKLPSELEIMRSALGASCIM